jgi:hypothetical protein
LLSLFSGDADSVAGFDGGGISEEGVGLLISFVLEGEATVAGDCATGDGGGFSYGEINADADGGSDGGNTDEDENDLSSGGDARFGWFGEEKERGAEQKGAEFVAQG